MKPSSVRSLIAITIALLVAGLLAWAGSSHGTKVGGISVFVLCAMLAFAIQWLAFIPAYLYQTEHFYDLVGTMTYLTLMGCALWLVDNIGIRSMLLALLIGIWATRLGSFLFIRVSKDGSDCRFDHIKPYFLRFLTAWTLQGLWVFITASSALAAISSDNDVPLGAWGIAGLCVWLSGFAIEVVSDFQKRQFRAALKGERGFIQSGLWSYSRHPNYFGEIVLWIGISMIALPALSGWQYATLISPVFVALLIIRISGINLLEASADKRWGGVPEYENYKASTPVLVPRLRKPR
ncbi:DUF1295 domain-containing protein [Parahaliea mediterranea]|uniref:DUF1295 domain-containing protein n=1 Tax=Parahaliea mediterranea TaxID=651086 RepID=A0A939DEI1_9GAMM|nr:DUF1295 domain-containing protein [Parahaliea mediterranea]MBN7796421.1 DUF1295 domain-containing protein [Parahaliea mediterranea]